MVDSLSRWLIRIECLAAAASLLAMLLLSLLQILMRNFMDTGFVEIETINRYLLIISGMLGASIATTQFRHIKIDALSTVMSDHLKEKLRTPVLLFATATCAALCYYSIIFCLDEWEYAPSNERWALPFILIYPVGFSLMALHFFLNIFDKDEHAGD